MEELKIAFSAPLNEFDSETQTLFFLHKEQKMMNFTTPRVLAFLIK